MTITTPDKDKRFFQVAGGTQYGDVTFQIASDHLELKKSTWYQVIQPNGKP